jgi:acyl-CoA synthetase (AMP-forming)/AMP-acid ligase II
VNIAEIFEQEARTRPNRAAIVDVLHGRERTFTFGALNDKAAQVAALLQSHGVEPGNGVLIFHRMAAELYIFLLALFRLGAVGLFMDPSAGRAHIERCCRIFPPTAFFGSARAHFLRVISPEIRRVPLHFASSRVPGSIDIFCYRSGDANNKVAETDDEFPALVTFTSGSTGVPKTAVRTHGFLRAQHKAIEQARHPVPDSVDLATLPIFVLANLASGITSVFPDADMRRPGSCDPRPIIAQIELHRARSTAASPAFIERLTDECIRTSRPVASLRQVFVGGGPVFPTLLRSAREAFPNATITAVYGSTEAEPMAEIAIDRISEEDFSCMRNGGGLLAGMPVDSVDLRIIRDQWGTAIGRISAAEFAALTLAVNQPGEIVVSGAHVLGGYLHGAGDEESKFNVDQRRWHRTGDLGSFDPSGRLWLLGRCSAKIEDRRGTVYPFKVECAVRHDPQIECAALVAFRGQRVLVLQARNARRLDCTLIKKRLLWASIDRCIAVERIPTDNRHNAKIDYVQLDLLLQRCRSLQGCEP